MAEQKKRKSTRTRSTARRAQSASRSRAPSSSSQGGDEHGPAPFESQIGSLIGSITDLTSDLTSTALKLASRTRESASRAIRRSPEQLRMMAAAGESLRDMREVAGMTVLEVTDALNLKDKSIWEAVEDGRDRGGAARGLRHQRQDQDRGQAAHGATAAGDRGPARRSRRR